MREADAAVYVFRGGGPQLLVGAAFCRLHRRRLVFSSAIDLEFDFERPDRARSHLALFRAAVKRADLIVVQTEHQAELARAAGLAAIVRIPSFAAEAPASVRAPEAFVWIGRLVTYKRPLEYVKLAELVPEAEFRMIYFELPDSAEDHALVERFERDAPRVPNLTLLGRRPHAETLAEIDRSIAVVATSRAEGMPNIFLEAWMRSIPVLSLEFDPDGLLGSGEGPGLVAGGSIDALAEAARALSADRGKRAELGARGRNYVLANHGPAVVGRRWAERVRALLPG
jgi:glycosyltransferase involved in cell wall biosynthesis